MPGSPIFNQVRFRVRNDDGSETTATWFQNVDTNATIAVDTNFRVRITTQNAGQVGVSNRSFNLYYSLNNGNYTAVTDSTPVKFSASSNFTDGADCTQQLGFDDGNYWYSDNNGMKETTGGAVNSCPSNSQFETEWCLQLDSAQVADTDTIDLRLYNATTAYNSYLVTPRITVSESGSAQNLTLTCDAGSYSLTGTSVTLTHTPASQNLTLACNAGSYSLTGTNADLTVTYTAAGGALLRVNMNAQMQSLTGGLHG